MRSMAREPRHGKKALRRLFHSRPQGRNQPGPHPLLNLLCSLRSDRSFREAR